MFRNTAWSDKQSLDSFSESKKRGSTQRTHESGCFPAWSLRYETGVHSHPLTALYLAVLQVLGVLIKADHHIFTRKIKWPNTYKAFKHFVLKLRTYEVCMLLMNYKLVNEKKWMHIYIYDNLNKWRTRKSLSHSGHLFCWLRITESFPFLEGLASEMDSPHPGNCDCLRLGPDKGWIKQHFPLIFDLETDQKT